MDSGVAEAGDLAIDRVMAEQEDLVEIVATLKQVICSRG
jgi:hypothetical protein